MRTIFIGDVHGCIEELASLICSLRLEKNDRVIFVGDLVDKGPESLQVLRYVECLIGQFPGSACVAGNHEEKALRQSKKDEAGRLTLVANGKAEPWTLDATPADWAFIESMPLMWWDATLNVRVVHGGVFPSMLQKQPYTFDRIVEVGKNWHKGGGKIMDRARRMLRTRYVGGIGSNQFGEMLELGKNGPHDPFWAETWKGPETVIYGHSPWLTGMIRVDQFALGIDTACVFGGRLTAVALSEVTTDVMDGIEVISEAAVRQYAEPLKEEDPDEAA
jgi:serine/threonine protein phosphatase 1